MGVLRRMFTAILALALLLTLAGCQCKHEWAEADCGNPKTCAKCGETEGEPLGHDWKDATCQAPKTCTRCGLTEGETVDHSWEAATCEAPETCAVCGLTRGEALGHIWKEANYQDPETCATCGQTQGEPLEADFEKHGLEINLWENKHYAEKTEASIRYGLFAPEEGFPYVNTCPKGENKKTTGALFVCNYRIFPSDETHQAVDGYEWRAFDVEIEFSDENANKYGASYTYKFDNYYSLGTADGTVDPKDYDMNDSDVVGTQWEYLAGTADYAAVSEISFHGETCSIVKSLENSRFGGWWKNNATGESVNTYYASLYACVPIGYDGVMVVFVDKEIVQYGVPIYEYADENTLFFRMDDQVLDLDW